MCAIFIITEKKILLYEWKKSWNAGKNEYKLIILDKFINK